MAKETPRDQPTKVATQEALRPPDNAVVTSDTPQEDPPETAGASATRPAAASKDGDPPPADANKSNSADDADNKQTPKPKRTPSIERRFRKLSGRLSRTLDTTQAQARRISELENENRTLRDATPDPVEPKLEDFRTPQEYATAYAKFKKPTPRTTPAVTAPPADPPQMDPTVSAFQERGRELLGDEFVEALEEEGTAVSQVMAEFLFDDDDAGPAIYVHLANNQEDARKIYDMSAPKAAKAMEALRVKAEKGELDIEGTLQIAAAPNAGEHDTGDDKTPPASPNPGGSKAPPPPSSTREAGDSQLQPDPESEGMEEYAARRRKEIARRAGHLV